MTIIITFQDSGYRTFKDYYTKQVIPNWRSCFPKLVSYNRFVELKQTALIPLLYYLHTCKGTVTGISFIDSTPIKVCHTRCASRHQVFEGLAKWGKNSIGNQVLIITVHQSKGLEFDTVFIAGASKDEFPGYFSMRDGKIEEEKRLFYVAMTRAQKRLFISAFLKDSGRYSKSPSQFIDSIPKE